ncbi:MAG TPA: hypothetical protein VHG28_17540 [Longimicrobiaceae bacterium]|nr:hypothetical protein [Longimicrobiaceae bacterium]
MNRRPYPPSAQVSGGNILSMLAAMGPFRRRGEQILKEHGIENVTAHDWYPLEGYVRALETIGEKMGPNTLFQIGKQIPNHVMLPPGLDTFEKVAASFQVAFEMNHRGHPGGITYQMTGEHSVTIVTGTPYPTDFDRGVTEGFFQKLISTRVNVVEATSQPSKRDGAETSTFLVSSL